jgi:ferritin-like metal-binding protein YciE
MAKAAGNKELAEGLKTHLNQSREHSARLERLLKTQSESTRGSQGKGMAGLIKEGQEMIDEDAG